MREVAIIGCGMLKCSKSIPGSLIDLGSEASLKAIEDAGVSKRDINAFYFGNYASRVFNRKVGAATAIVDDLGLIPIPAHTTCNGCAAGAQAIRQAYISIAGGFYDVVLVTGAEKPSGVPGAVFTDTVAQMTHPEAEYAYGIGPPALAAMATRAYKERYGLTEDQLAAVSAKNHENGMKNPYAQLHKPATIEGVKDSIMICDPLRLYHICPVGDGAGSLVLCAAEKAHEFTDKPIMVAGVGQATDMHACQEREDPLTFKSVQLASRQAYEMAGLGPKDIDVAELHDAFEILEIIESEDAGFFPKGEGAKAAEEGKTKLDGEIAINPSGGLKARGHPLGATGVVQAVEIVWQLRGEAGERQVKNAKNGYCLNFGGVGDNVVATVLKRGF